MRFPFAIFAALLAAAVAGQGPSPAPSPSSSSLQPIPGNRPESSPFRAAAQILADCRRMLPERPVTLKGAIIMRSR